nr:tryptophan synthase subunit alpha [Candidatus Microthrix sp.]
MDGPTIQAASDQALREGALPYEVIEAAGAADVGIPLAVMTYYNLVFRPGVTRFAGGIGPCPALPGPSCPTFPWTRRPVDCGRRRGGVETVLLAAPPPR